MKKPAGKKRIFIALIIALFMIAPTTSYALSFGGKVIFNLPCTVPPGLVLFVGPPRPGAFLYVPKVSTLYQFFKPIIGSWVLGNYVPLSGCVVGICPFCYIQPLMGTITKIGTSL